MSGPWEQYARPEKVSGPWSAYATTKPEPKQAQPTLWETIKQAAKPDIFNAGEAGHVLGGKVTDTTGSPALGTAVNVASQAIPMLAGGMGGVAVGTQPMKAAARGLMSSAIKPSVANLHKGKVPAAVETMLEGGYSPTNSGVAAMRSKVSSLSDDVSGMIAPSNKLVDIAPAAQNVAGVADKARAGTMGVQEANTATDVAKSLYAHPAVDDLGTMSVQAAQAMKQANYKSMGDAAYGLGLKPAAERDALKAVTAALKKGIETAEPRVAPINKNISDLVNAIKVSERRALIEGNKDIVPLGASVATALNNPAAALGLYANSSAAIKSILARLLHSGAEKVPAAVGGSVGLLAGSPSGNADLREAR